MIAFASPSFLNLHNHGFVRVAAGAPSVRVADPAHNAACTLEMIQSASIQGASLVLLPELGLSGYAIDDLLQQSALLDAVEQAIADLCTATHDLKPIVFVGAPVRVGDRLFNA